MGVSSIEMELPYSSDPVSGQNWWGQALEQGTARIHSSTHKICFKVAWLEQKTSGAQEPWATRSL